MPPTRKTTTRKPRTTKPKADPAAGVATKADPADEPAMVEKVAMDGAGVSGSVTRADQVHPTQTPEAKAKAAETRTIRSERKRAAQAGGKSTALDKAIAAASKKWDVRIAPLSELDEVEALTTGNLAVDYITGVWGLPKGRIIELYGPESSGKSTTAFQTAVAAQAAGQTVLYLDFENALDPDYLQALGLQIDKQFLPVQPEYMEQGFNAMRELVETGEIGLVIVDSVAAMVTEREEDTDFGASATHLQKSQLMSAAMRKLTGPLKRTGTTCVFINQTRDKIAMSGGPAAAIPQSTTPGGKALKFHASMRVEYKVAKKVVRDRFNPLTAAMEKVPVEQDVIVTVRKNKVGPPFRKALVRMTFGQGLSQAWSVKEILIAYGLIKRDTSGNHKFTETTDNGYNAIKGEEALIRAIEADPDWMATLTGVARKILEEGKPAPQETSQPVLEVVPDTPDPEEEIDPLDVLVPTPSPTAPSADALTSTSELDRLLGGD